MPCPGSTSRRHAATARTIASQPSAARAAPPASGPSCPAAMSKRTTSSPAARRRLTNAAPISPPLPVTRMRILSTLHGGGGQALDEIALEEREQAGDRDGRDRGGR